MKAAAGFIGLLLVANPAASKSPTHVLSDAESQRWIAAAKAQRTADGVTLLEALRHAQTLRPDKFRFGKFAIGYDARTGEPDAVTVETWIGTNRRPDDTSNIMLPIKRSGDKVSVVIPRAAGLFLDGLRKGQNALVTAIDEQYQDVCINYKSRAKTC